MGILLAAILLTTAVVLFVLYPVIRGQSAPMGRVEDEPTEAEARSRVTLLALRDVEYDYVSGKLDDADYARLRKELSVEALEALKIREREMEESDAGWEVPAGLEEEIARARRGLRAGLFCTGCGHPNEPGSRFCAHCGSALTPDAPGGVAGRESAGVGEAGD